MKLLFYMGHPAHYHNFSVVIPLLIQKGHQVHVVARAKDVLFQLLEDTPYPVTYLPARQPSGKMGLIWNIFQREIQMWRICKQFKPDMLIGTDIVITHIGKWLKKPSVVVNEDDAAAVPLFANWGNRYGDYLLAPESCNVGIHQSKKIAYPGYQELAYLHPNYFTPDAQKVKSLVKNDRPYFLIRFAKLDAHHDDGKTGISGQLAQQIIAKLTPKGTVWITSERPLPKELEPYRIQVHPKDMHHALYFADLYIGDSQTMAAEAAVLGTPSLRFNDFVGRLGYLEELEHRFGLTFGIPTSQPEALLNKLDELLKTINLKSEWAAKRQTMLAASINVADFWVWLFEDLDMRAREVQQHPEVLKKFK